MHENVFFLTIEQKMSLKRLQKLRCLGWISKQDMLRSAVKKTSLKSSKDDFVTKIFPHSTKRKRSIHLNFPFPFVSFNSLFLTLKCETLILKTTAWCDSQMVWQFYLLVLYSHKPCFFSQSECALYLNFIIKTLRKHFINQKELKHFFTTVTMFVFIGFQIRGNRQIFKFSNFRLKISGFSRCPYEVIDIMRI